MRDRKGVDQDRRGEGETIISRYKNIYFQKKKKECSRKYNDCLEYIFLINDLPLYVSFTWKTFLLGTFLPPDLFKSQHINKVFSDIPELIKIFQHLQFIQSVSLLPYKYKEY